MTGGLQGVRVLEIGEMVAAPYATKLLADLGADVIKIESPAGDRARSRGPFPDDRPDDPNVSGLFLALNTNKRSVVLGPDDSDRLAALVADADIIITNYRTAELAELGFDAAASLAARPELVICSITPFGLTGPYAEYAAEELTISHGGGWAYQCPGASQDVDDPPLKVFGHQTDFHAAIAGAMAALAAFDRAEQTGIGEHIDLSSMAHTAGMLEAALIAASYMEADPSRLGSRLLNPWKIFRCKPEPGANPADELVFLVTVEQDQWERLVEFMGAPEWTETGLFDTLDLRLENEDLLIHYLQEWTERHTVSELFHGGQAQRICLAPVLTMADMERQEHLAERGFFVPVTHPAAGTIDHLGPPFLSTPNLRSGLGPAPLLDPDAEAAFGAGRAKPDAGTAAPATAAPDLNPATRPLDGVRVLDLSWVWAGPYCALHLAHLGAEVVKVESEQRPGLGRRLPLHPGDVEPTLNTSAYFNQWEQGKLSCGLDLARPEAIEIVKQLVASSDVVVENFATGVMDKLGLSYDELRAVKPDIIVASISGYGNTGPLKSYMGYGPTTGPLSGLTSLTGYRGGPPRELGISVGDPAAGITSAFAICAALVAKRRTGDGCYIDTALWESTASNAVEGWMAHAMGAGQPERAGNRDQRMAPHGCYRTGDLYPDDEAMEAAGATMDPGCWISIACVDDERWLALAKTIDASTGGNLETDERFATEADRKANEDELDAIVQGWVAGRDRWDLTKSLQAVGVAAFPSMSTQDLLADPHLEARGFFERLDHPEVGARVHAGVPWRLANSPNGVTFRAPLIGEHTGDVLGRLLGLSDERIQQLERDGIIG